MFKLFSTVRGINLPLRFLTHSSPINVFDKNICSDVYLGIDITAAQVSKQKLLTMEPAVFKEKLKADFEESGLRSIFSEDVKKFIILGETKEDFDLALNLLIEGFNPIVLRLEQFSDSGLKNLVLYFRMCYLKNLPSQAIAGRNNLALKSSTLMENNKSINKLYFDLLFKNNLHQEVLNEFLTNKEHYLKQSIPTTIAFLSCYKLGTRESLKQSASMLVLATKLNMRVSHICSKSVALLSYNLEEYALAHDIIRKYGSSIFHTTLELMVLTATGRLDEAVLLFRVKMLPKYPAEKNREVFYCGVAKLMVAVKESGDKEMLKEVMEMVIAMDETVTVRNETLEDIILMPIVPKLDHGVGDNKSFNNEKGRKIFINNISKEATYEDFQAEVEKHGEVTDFYNPGRGFGFITFAANEEGQACIAAMDNTEISGRIIQMDIARAKPAPGTGGKRQEADPGCKLLVHGITKETDNSSIQTAFEAHGTVMDAYNTGKGFAFVTFSNVSEANVAMAAFSENEVCGCNVIIKVARDKKDAGAGGRGGARGVRGGGGGGGTREEIE